MAQGLGLRMASEVMEEMIENKGGNLDAENDDIDVEVDVDAKVDVGEVDRIQTAAVKVVRGGSERKGEMTMTTTTDASKSGSGSVMPTSDRKGSVKDSGPQWTSASAGVGRRMSEGVRRGKRIDWANDLKGI